MGTLFGEKHNPDVLSCIANLSNDEVFTPPELVNQMLDMLPEELWSDPSATFLDPACKSGVFLREIAKRLIKGLEDEIPDLEERLEHIYKKQLYGIAITELTSLLSRRSLYCSKWPNSVYSVVKFDNPKGNIDYVKMDHSWEGGRCKYCGAAEREYKRDESLEQYAYEFIHLDDPEEVLPVKFDVVIGNPPYQLSDGGAAASAKPIYNHFIDKAKKLNPRYLVMIVPSRWMTGGKGLDHFRIEMIDDRRIRELHDFADSKMCFEGVDIKGGVCYFLWDRAYNGDCMCVRHNVDGVFKKLRPLREDGLDIFVREPMLVEINSKVSAFREPSIANIVSARKPYGLTAESTRNAAKFGLPEFSDSAIEGGYSILGLGSNQRRCWKYLPKDYPIPKKDPSLDKYKVFIAEAYGCGEIGEVPSTPVLSTPVLSTPGELCTETFLQIGPFDTESEARNLLSYIRTKFFRTLVGIKKQTQHTTKKVYELVPMQDFSKPWTDEELYAKYGLTNEEIAFIESVVSPMDLGGDSDD